MTHMIRPARITAILATIGLNYPAEVLDPLKSYITDLETRQQAPVSGDGLAPSSKPDSPPIWSYQRVMKREQRRRERILRKLNTYQ